jgi:acyl-CoA thioester hydrolase
MLPFPVTVTFPLHWGDMDALGHVNNTRYFRWFESARIEFFARIGIMADRPREIGPILATTSCDFVQAIAYPATVVVGTRVTKVGRTSIAMEYAVWLADAPEVIRARGTSVIVLVDYGTMQKVEVPADVRARIDALHAVGAA